MRPSDLEVNGAWFGIVCLALQYFFESPRFCFTLEITFQLIWNLHSPTKLIAMLSAAAAEIHTVFGCEMQNFAGQRHTFRKI